MFFSDFISIVAVCVVLELLVLQFYRLGVNIYEHNYS